MKHTPSNINFVFIVIAVILLIIGIFFVLSDEVIVVLEDPEIVVVDKDGNGVEYNQNLNGLTEYFYVPPTTTIQ